MDKAITLDKLIAAQPTADLVLLHGYLPQGSSHVVQSLNEIHKTAYGHGEQLYCADCVVRMFKRLYNHLKPQLLAELTPKEEVKPKSKKSAKA